jgi:hypothetical protein
MFRLTGNQPRTIDHPRGKTFVLFRQAMANGDERNVSIIVLASLNR